MGRAQVCDGRERGGSQGPNGVGGAASAGTKGRVGRGYEAVRSPSLRRCARKHPETTPLCVRLSFRSLSFDGDVLNIPLYPVHRAASFIEQALAKVG